MPPTSTVAVLGRRTDLDPFLFAPIGEERNGMLLSVLSALARLDKDPWQEAATLNTLPVQDAAARLTSLLSGAANPPEPTTIARLIALLPRSLLHEGKPREIAWGSPKSTPWVVAAYIVMAFIMICTEQLFERPDAAGSLQAGATAHSAEADVSPKADFKSIGGQ